VKKPILVIHLEAQVTTTEPERRLAELRKRLAERDPVHNLLRSAGVRFEEKWKRVPPAGAGKQSRRK
jgi:hypothetical protein